jgi:hypothetical protein
MDFSESNSPGFYMIGHPKTGKPCFRFLVRQIYDQYDNRSYLHCPFCSYKQARWAQLKVHFVNNHIKLEKERPISSSQTPVYDSEVEYHRESPMEASEPAEDSEAMETPDLIQPARDDGKEKKVKRRITLVSRDDDRKEMKDKRNYDHSKEEPWQQVERSHKKRTPAAAAGIQTIERKMASTSVVSGHEFKRPSNPPKKKPQSGHSQMLKSAASTSERDSSKASVSRQSAKNARSVADSDKSVQYPGAREGKQTLKSASSRENPELQKYVDIGLVDVDEDVVSVHLEEDFFDSEYSEEEAEDELREVLKKKPRAGLLIPSKAVPSRKQGRKHRRSF